MKAILSVALSAFLFVGCSKSGSDAPPAPAASLTGGTWRWSSEKIETMPKDGRPATTSIQTVQTGVETQTYGTDGFLTVSYDGVAQPKVNYAFANATITLTRLNNTATLAVGELTANRLVYTQATESTDNRYRITTTLTRN
jgi:PBP1b-binding outer membrane lipoprotein LpoB